MLCLSGTASVGDARLSPSTSRGRFSPESKKQNFSKIFEIVGFETIGRISGEELRTDIFRTSFDD
jgi:hypothetical protein